MNSKEEEKSLAIFNMNKCLWNNIHIYIWPLKWKMIIEIIYMCILVL